MSYRFYSPEIYCYVGNIMGPLYVTTVQFINSFWYIITGMSIVYTDLYLAVLVVWAHPLAVAHSHVLRRFYDQPRPPCSPVANDFINEHRMPGLPANEIVLCYFAAAFLFANFVVIRKLYTFRLMLSVWILPAGVAVFGIATQNVTATQLFVSAAIGSFDGVLFFTIFHFMLRHPMEYIADQGYVRFFLPHYQSIVTTDKILTLFNLSPDDDNPQKTK